MNPFEFLFDSGDLRKIKHDGQELIQRIYYAVRDEEWLNTPYTLMNYSSGEENGLLKISYELFFKRNRIKFSARFDVAIGYNSIVLETNGTALSDFRKNRIGLCVHLPVSLKGIPCEITHWDGSRTTSFLPILVSPHQPFKNISEITLIFSEFSILMKFEGDIFEMEDQRNWTDASYKIYSTPLDLPFPVEVKKGDTFTQKITVSLVGLPQNPAITPNNEEKIVPAPDFGIFDLNNLNTPCKKNRFPLYVRVDFRLHEKTWREEYKSVLQKAGNFPQYYCMLYLSANYKEEMADFLHFVDNECLKEKIYSVALLSTEEFVLPDGVLGELTVILRGFLPAVRIGAGTDANFAQLNRNRPETCLLDFIFYSIQPQEHASDRLSLIENIMGQYDTVQTAKHFGNGKSIDISALSFFRRFNANVAVTASKEPMVDYEFRGTPFEAAWFIGALHQLVVAGVHAVTCIGCMDEKSPLRVLFDFMAKHRPEYFYTEGSPLPEKYSLISWVTQGKKYSVFGNLTRETLTILDSAVKRNLNPDEILYVESED